MDWISALTAGSLATAIAHSVKHISNGLTKYGSVKVVCRRDVEIKRIEYLGAQRRTAGPEIVSDHSTTRVPVDASTLINFDAILEDQPPVHARRLLGRLDRNPKGRESSSSEGSS